MERLSRYSELVVRLASSLREDASAFAPPPDGYSPYAIAYGFTSDIVASMATRALIVKTAIGFSLEDAFVASDANETRRAWTTPWKSAFHEGGQHAIVDYSQDFAERIYGRLTDALGRPRIASGRLLVAASSAAVAGAVPADEFVYRTTDSFDRREGRCVVSYEADGQWVAISKSVLTKVMGQGRDALVTNVDPQAIDVLRLTCPGVTMVG
jgi:hypothetical protein